MRQENGYYYWNKGEKDKLLSNFSTSEFDCQCAHKSCVGQKISVDLISRLQKVRDEVGPIKITSGFRCVRHQTDLVGGGKVETVKISQHESGNAADIKPLKSTVVHLLGIAAKHFDAIGIAGTWLHVDTRVGHRRWRYK